MSQLRLNDWYRARSFRDAPCASHRIARRFLSLLRYRFFAVTAGVIAASLFSSATPIRCDAETPEILTSQPVALGFDAAVTKISDRDPERVGAQMVRPSGAGLVYFIGNVNRPGGVPVDSTRSPTLLQALALAGGPGRRAALTKAVLIREREEGRTVVTLNLKRILRGEDPDVPVRDRDIVFVPSRW